MPHIAKYLTSHRHRIDRTRSDGFREALAVQVFAKGQSVAKNAEFNDLMAQRIAQKATKEKGAFDALANSAKSVPKGPPFIPNE